MKKIVLAAGLAAGLTLLACGPANGVLRSLRTATGSTTRTGLGIVVPAYWYQGAASWKVLATMHNPPGGRAASPRTR